MVRLFIIDSHFAKGMIPSGIIDFYNFNGRVFHEYTRAFYALYEGLSIRLVFMENSSGDFREFAVVTIEYNNGVFSRRIERKGA